MSNELLQIKASAGAEISVRVFGKEAIQTNAKGSYHKTTPGLHAEDISLDS